ncbi:hypothetical protein AMAG_17112 [Allomyces macrogynus ATCC 38327]|uniref:Uncharacterized protein n=1 Tax=Allomyces macrogynus (strain ATCC 38327) TaxID=578462 RepID=A0A0L0TDX2_ALLM3|nr:hypothetical protein AMAG_17112 [Allomyces macrogynus ATCC 38327]|eukprot:KNE72784.1 hypothetical protein AMAG_17112 [Allomyces macrogynus ATCC 38327]
MPSAPFQKLSQFGDPEVPAQTAILVDDTQQRSPSRAPMLQGPATPPPAQGPAERVAAAADSFLDQFSWMNSHRKVLLRAVLGEGLVTFLFLFIVCATHVNHVRSQTPDSLVLSAISTGFASIALIYSFADVSGAHFNPAVTFATIVTGKTSPTKGALYIAMQLFSAIMATVFVKAVFPKAMDGASTLQLLFVDVGTGSDAFRAFGMEFILTFILVYVIFATAFDTVDSSSAIKVETEVDEHGLPASPTPTQQQRTGAGRNLTIYTTSGNTKAGFAPLAIGMTLGFLCFIGGTVSGGAFNPARVFGPAMVGGYWNNHWVYWLGDFCGAAVAGFTQSFFAHRPVQSSVTH